MISMYGSVFFKKYFKARKRVKVTNTCTIFNFTFSTVRFYQQTLFSFPGNAFFTYIHRFTGSMVAHDVH